MARDKENKNWYRYIKFYGLNAILGFSLGVFLVLITLNVAGEGGVLVEENIQKSEAATPIVENASNHAQENSKDVAPSKGLEDYLTVLIVGVDNRPGEKFTSNTDSLIVTSIEPKNKKIVFLSIPRDTQVIMPNGSKEKINALARLGQGISSTEQYVEGLISQPIDGYVITNFQGFKGIIDSLGGVTVTVEKDMFYDTGDKEDRYIDLKEGTQRLNGAEALQYARFRNDELADISRTERQQKVLKAIVEEASSPRNLPRIPNLIAQTSRMIETNLSISQTWSLAKELPNIKNYEIINQTLPGGFWEEDGISYWKVEQKDTTNIIANLFEGNKPSVFKYSFPPQNKIHHSVIEEKVGQDNSERKHDKDTVNKDNVNSNKGLERNTDFKPNEPKEQNEKNEDFYKNRNDDQKMKDDDKLIEEQSNNFEKEIMFEVLEA